MGHAAGEKPESLHFPGPVQVFLQLVFFFLDAFLFRDVTADSPRSQQVSRIVVVMDASRLDDAEVSVFVLEDAFHGGERLAGRDFLHEHGVEFLPFTQGKVVDEPGSQKFQGRIPGDDFHAGAVVDEVSALVDVPDSVAGGLHQISETLFTFFQGLFRHFPFGNVVDHHTGPGDPSVLENETVVQNRRKGAAILVDDVQFHVP